MDRASRQAKAVQAALDSVERGESMDRVLSALDGQTAGLVELAAALRDTLPTRPAPVFRASLQASLQQELAATRPASVTHVSQRRAWGLLSGAWLRFAALSLAVALSVGTAAIASAESMPGELLYPVKRTVERAEVALAFDPSARAMVHLRHADIRLAEIRELVDRGIVVPAALIEDLLATQREAADAARLASDAGLAAMVAREIESNVAQLNALLDIVAEPDADDLPLAEDVPTEHPTRRRPGNSTLRSPTGVPSSPGDAGGADDPERPMTEGPNGTEAVGVPVATDRLPLRTALPAQTSVVATPVPTVVTVATNAPATSVPTGTPPPEATSPFGPDRDIRVTEWARMTETAEGNRPDAETPVPTATPGSDQRPEAPTPTTGPPEPTPTLEPSEP